MKSFFFQTWLLTKLKKQKGNRSTSAFTLIEVLVVMLIIGILSAIAAPSWYTFTLNQKLNSAQNEVYRALQNAQSLAKRNATTYQVSFRAEPSTQKLQYAVHRAGVGFLPTTPAQWSGLAWQSLYEDSSGATAIITMRGVSTSYPASGSEPVKELTSTGFDVRRFRFGSKGNFQDDLLNRYLVLRTNPTTQSRRCVTIATLLGATRTLKEGESACAD